MTRSAKEDLNQMLRDERFALPHECVDGSPAAALLKKDVPNARGFWSIAMQEMPFREVNYTRIDFCPWCGARLEHRDTANQQKGLET